MFNCSLYWLKYDLDLADSNQLTENDSRYLCFKQIVFNSLSLIIWQPGLIGPLAQSAGSGDTYQAAADRLNYGRQDVV